MDHNGVPPFFLPVQRRLHRAVVIADPGERLAARLRDHQRVELSVPLEHTAAVDADDLPRPFDDGIGTEAVSPIECHGPVPHHAVFGEDAALTQEIVIFHALPSIQLLHVRIGGHPAMDKDKVLRL